MMGISSPLWLSAGWCLHAIFVFVSLIGAVLFVAWALRLKAENLKTWVMWLLVVGLLGSLLTSGFSMMGWKMMMRGPNGAMMMNWDDMMELQKKGMMNPGEMMKKDISPGEQVKN